MLDKGHESVHSLQSQLTVCQADATPLSFEASDLGGFADLVRPFYLRIFIENHRWARSDRVVLILFDAGQKCGVRVQSHATMTEEAARYSSRYSYLTKEYAPRIRVQYCT